MESTAAATCWFVCVKKVAERGVLAGSLRELDGVHVRCIFRMPGGGFHCTISFSVMLAPRAGGGDAGYVASGWTCALPPSLAGLVRDELGHSMSHLCPPHIATSGGATIVEGGLLQCRQI